ncbi:indole-3-acetic acid-amido synthetase GH3.6-like [Papaver somniferum]|uniref:indole-3-acetic acid-amido synthetase GH3.6-like n=1 Tax=Papaver somniferum TaxID=3469 RepID=UPI000E7022B8|nr:indole-3-acetic acid-amido synthetase GH3.6-like [Papaver somniferum]
MDIPDAIDNSIDVAENSNIANCSDTIDEHYHDKKKKEALQFIEEITINADEVQNQALAEILSCNAQVDYLQRHGLNGQTDRKTFKRIMPVVTYEDLKPDIDLLIAKGNSISSTLCKSPISQFFCSTGTSSGMSKLIPSTEEQAEKSRQFFSLLIPVLNQHIPGLNKGNAMQIIFVSPCTETPGGIISSLVSTSVAKTSRNLSSNINYTSPIETILCEDTHQSLYYQLLCDLYQNKQVLRLGFAFASGFMVAVKCLQQHWTLLCDDIRHGTISEDHPKITDPSVRKAVMKILVKTNPELADFIENECKRDSSWESIVSRLWPNAKCIVTIITGTMSHHIDNIDFYSNGLPIVSHMYACSECFLGINLDPLTKPPEVSYTLIPTMVYFEFLTILGEDDDQKDNCNRRKNNIIQNWLISSRLSLDENMSLLSPIMQVT